MCQLHLRLFIYVNAFLIIATLCIAFTTFISHIITYETNVIYESNFLNATYLSQNNLQYILQPDYIPDWRIFMHIFFKYFYFIYIYIFISYFIICNFF